MFDTKMYYVHYMDAFTYEWANIPIEDYSDAITTMHALEKDGYINVHLMDIPYPLEIIEDNSDNESIKEETIPELF